MKVSRENCPVKPLIGKMKREKIVLKHKLQRRESVWSFFCKLVSVSANTHFFTNVSKYVIL